MNQVTVHASRSYDILIGHNLLPLLPRRILALGGVEKICVVSDSNVFPLYGQTITELLSDFDCFSYVFPAGEASKNGSTYLDLLNTLALHAITRSDLIVALGGGVSGDLAGFAAATYLRGIRFVQIPTTLLAAVDSSVGGKTAIDLPAGKNLAGTFSQPSLVLCDLDTLNTLPQRIFLEGCAEVIKYAVLYDPELFAHLKEKGPDFDRERVITRCVELKRDVVEQDEFDTGLRKKLNLGHTIGHGIEAGSDFRISHGEAVAAGLAIVTRAACALGLCAEDTCQEISDLIIQFKLPIRSDFSAPQLLSYALSDKKRTGSHIDLIVPRRIGLCDILPTPVEDLEAFIKAGL